MFNIRCVSRTGLAEDLPAEALRSEVIDLVLGKVNNLELEGFSIRYIQVVLDSEDGPVVIDAEPA